ncbi:uncharacterized protein BDR25DRAFT_342066 [Lindgomyces ingoldianus]|uniref:Uncharacterized protein n=1 Tax=Lindgomyces ingoldianus TaxID=673940 RepID=A0ACB6QYQ8_9PLEO|nr:uncharacterized protein BDR25DRAFT_342066 [Lindgomyces ingoldianus]KAF2472031.1 hypothetical protein BDR25DRAFT_342066 [Lindgomyces ingoldianus]
MTNQERPGSPTPSTSTAYLDTKITLDNFRTLLGLPSDRAPIPPTHLPRWWPESLRHRRLPDPEENIGIYSNILYQERITQRQYGLFKSVIYGGLITQLLLSALLILLASVPSNHHVAIAVFGALNGVITGILALVGGQGLPNRLLQYSDGLRALRERVEWLERELEAGMREVRYREVVGLREAYEGLRGDEQVNRPDFWVSFGGRGRGAE